MNTEFRIVYIVEIVCRFCRYIQKVSRQSRKITKSQFRYLVKTNKNKSFYETSTIKTETRKQFIINYK
jgi:hypothetical protein